VIFCSGSLIANLKEHLITVQEQTTLRVIVCFDKIDVETVIPIEMRQVMEKKNIKIVFWDEIMNGPEIDPKNEIRPTPSDIHLLLYTSGTTGMPKGVIIKHSMVVASVDRFLAAPHWKGICPDTYFHLSFLPLAHSFEQDVINFFLRCGSSIGFLSGPLTKLFEDIEILKPEILFAVPRVWKRFYDAVNDNIAKSGWIKKTLFNFALSQKIACNRAGTTPLIPWDKLVLHNVADKLGGRMLFCISGGAALDPALAEWVKAIGVPVCRY
jgi:long-chain acyl-CoA synthetase